MARVGVWVGGLLWLFAGTTENVVRGHSGNRNPVKVLCEGEKTWELLELRALDWHQPSEYMCVLCVLCAPVLLIMYVACVSW